MGEIRELIGMNWISVFLGVFIILFALKEVIEIVGYFRSKFGIKTKADEKEEETDKRFEKLEEHDAWQYDKINEITENLAKIEQVLQTMSEEQKKCTVASFRSTLYRIHKEFVAQGFATTQGLKTFIEIGKIYESSGGDDIYHSKLYPEVLALPIKD